MKLKPSCSFCKDHSKFTENTQLRVLLQCYKRLCKYINSTSIPNKWGSMNVTCPSGSAAQSAATAAAASHGVGSLIAGPTNFFQLIEEGANLDDNFVFSASQNPAPPLATGKVSADGICRKPVAKNLPRNPPQPVHAPMPTVKKPAQQQPTLSEKKVKVSELSGVKATIPVVNVPTPPPLPILEEKAKISSELVTLMPEVNSGTKATLAKSTTSTFAVMKKDTDTKNGIVINVTGPGITQAKVVPIGMGSSTSNLTTPLVLHATVPPPGLGCLSLTPITPNASTSIANGTPSKPKNKRRGCRCGLATPNPGKLTCCGQRCPCYVDGKGCFECKCRGCRNPHKANTNSGIAVTPAVKPSSSHSVSKVPSGTMTLATGTTLVNAIPGNCQLISIPASAVNGIPGNGTSTPRTASITLTTTPNVICTTSGLFFSPSVTLSSKPSQPQLTTTSPLTTTSNPFTSLVGMVAPGISGGVPSSDPLTLPLLDDLASDDCEMTKMSYSMIIPNDS